MSFDDGPDPAWTPKILAVLREYHVPANFFTIGVHVADYPQLVRQELKDGATRADLVYGQSVTDACVDLGTTADMLGALAGAVSASRTKRRVAE